MPMVALLAGWKRRLARRLKFPRGREVYRHEDVVRPRTAQGFPRGKRRAWQDAQPSLSLWDRSPA